MKENKKPGVRLWMSILLSVIVLSVINGCGGNTKLTEETSPEPTAVEATATPKPKPKQTKKPKKKKEKPKETFDPFTVTKGDIEANFDEALKHVTICGKKVSFPLTLEKLGKDFSVKLTARIEDEPDYRGILLYKKNRVASIIIKDGWKRGNLRKKYIYHLSFISDITPDLDFDICGVNFNTPIEKMLDIWGEASDCPNEDYRTYKRNGKNGDSMNSIDICGTPGENVYSINIWYRRKK